jgi:hypothetical protein
MNGNHRVRRSMASRIGAALAAFSFRPQWAEAQSENGARSFSHT